LIELNKRKKRKAPEDRFKISWSIYTRINQSFVFLKVSRTWDNLTLRT